MKPHEETWTTETAGAPSAPVLLIFVVGEDGMKRPFTGDERMKLAAQAPAMARLLLRLEWAASDETGDLICPSCGSSEHASGAKHEDNCELAKLLRDAGVVP